MRLVVPVGLIVLMAAGAASAQPTPQSAQRRVNERILALQREAQQLAARSRTLLDELRQLEVERDLQNEKLAEAEAAAAEATAAVQQSAQRLAALEEQRVAQLPDIKLRLVDLYKRGNSGYAELLAGARSVRDLARATRAVASLTKITQQRLEEHRRTIEQVKAEQVTLSASARTLAQQRDQASRARMAAQRAVAARGALIAQIDARRDLTAQLTGELQVTGERLREQIASLNAGRPAEPVNVPITAFRGALDWPAAGRSSAARNGLEIAATEDSPVLAVHGGTVAYAEPFAGFGNLVIIDHGNGHHSVYGYLASIAVPRGARVEAGTELGRSGLAPAGPAALYFEMRVDGCSVDPVQWLRPR